ncbi:hypothetical protein PLICRDRAFT_281548 [Plicaturopsis crispa FD-325 SS-3]|nr:hypothetical protein PLICRDRAFT_281548 [Plicaturopsis crispa FD-325 SS-3]
MPETSYNLYVDSYTRGIDETTQTPLLPHWSFWIDTKQSRTVFHQVQGAAPHLRYEGEEKQIRLKPDTVEGIIHIGEVPKDSLDAVTELLETIPLRQDGVTIWGNHRACRAWCLDAIAPMKKKGWVYDRITPEVIMAALKPEWEE